MSPSHDPSQVKRRYREEASLLPLFQQVTADPNNMEGLRPHAANTSALTPLSFLDRAAVVYPKSPSVIYNSHSFTWSETRSRCLRLASSLVSSLSISPGDVVSVVAPNVPAMYEMQFAVPMTGAILNNLNLRLDARTLSVLIAHCSPKLIFVDHEYLQVIRTAFSLLVGDNPAPLLVPILEHGSDPVREGVLTYEGLVRRGDPSFRWLRPRSDWEPMVLNYTSGTTSAPKGVVHCHRALFLVSLDSLVDWSMPKQPVYLWTLPMFHANGWCYPWGIAAQGGTNVCIRRFDAAAVHAAIRRYGVTHLCGAPVVLNMLANDPSAEPLANPVEVLTAGAPPPAEVLRRTEALGFSVNHGYGLTETAGLVVSCAWKKGWNRIPASERARLKSRQGVRTLAMDEVDVVDPKTGESVRRDGVAMGEVVLRGGCVMLGYLKDPEATGRCMGSGGWFYTGDVGVMHPDGYLEIKDRSKDVIISGGENLSSVEVEAVLYSYPAVNEAAVVARPDEFWGESPCAFVSVKDGGGTKRPTEGEIMTHCREKLPRFMVPKTVVFLKELPKTSTGKIKKYELREMAGKMGPLVGGGRGSSVKVSRM